MKTIRRRDILLRIGASALVSIFIVLNGRWHQFTIAISAPDFYFALFISFLVAFFLLYLVRIGNTFLDREHPWEKHLMLRAFFQFILCFIVPTILDISIIAVYFRITSSEFNVTDYLMHDYPIIAMLLILLNSYYTIKHFSGPSHAPIQQQDQPAGQLMNLSRGRTLITVNVQTDILYCCRMAKRVQIYIRDGQRFVVEDSLRQLSEQFSESELLQINRSTIINMAIVQGYTKGVRRDTLQIIIKEPYAELPAMQNLTLFAVTKEYMEPFKAKIDLRTATPEM